jgi:phenylalanyl-tRNA synthetase beta chain
MIVTRSWLEEWIDLKGITTDELAKTFNSIGLEVDRVKNYEIPEKIVFGKVLECEKHPDADKLNVCKVDVGTTELQIVCGASNVRAGLDVVVATVGATMPGGLKIKPVKLRGVDSAGMICSASEIGLEDIQDGILELDNSIGKYQLGDEVSSNKILSDDLIEIELTANRGDCLSIRGVCRDLSAAFNRPIKTFTNEENCDKRGIGRVVSLVHDKNLDVKLSYRAIELKDLSVPLLVKLRMAQIEDKQDSDIESILHYVRHTSGVIVNAYDSKHFISEKQSAFKIKIDSDENGYTTILGKERASVVGVIQDESSKVKESEGLVFIEASYIPPDIISKKMHECKIESQSVYYNTSRGSEPEIECGLSLSLSLLQANSHSLLYSGNLEYGKIKKNKIVSIAKEDIDNIIGAKIDKVTIGKILTNLGFDIAKSSSNSFVVSVPQFRHDIVNKQDIVEEIVRLVGIDNIPSKPFILEESNQLEDDYFSYKKRTIFRHRAASCGFFESIHFVFDEKKVLNSYGFETTKNDLELLNPIVKTLDTLRPTLLTGLLKATSQNIKNGYSSVRLFEVGSVFSPLREESLKMAILFSGDRESQALSNSGKPAKVDFAYFTQKVADIIGEFELREYETKHKLSHTYQSAQIVVNGNAIGELFRVHPNVEKEYDLDVTYMCEIDFNMIQYELKTAKKASKYQASFRDLSLIIPNNINYERVKKIVDSLNIKDLVRFYPVDKYSDEKLGNSSSLSLRFVLQSEEKTLEEEDITKVMDAILDSLKDNLEIGLR